MSSDLLSIGASGLSAYKTALGTVGDNIANAQTVGYVKRTTRMDEISNGGPSVLYRNVDTFDGVEVSAIDRATDAFRVGEARLAISADGKAKAVADWMAITEGALDDSANGVGTAIATVFAGGDALAADPVARQPRTALLSAIDAAAQAIRTSAGDLQRASAGVGDAAKASVDGINANLSTLADINLAIKHTSPGTATFVQLSDQRDSLIDAVAGQVNVDITVASDGTTTLSSNGQPLLSGSNAATLTVTAAADGRMGITADGAVLTPTGGALAGLASAGNVIADRRAALDTMAGDFATAINQWQAAGRTPAGVAGPPLLNAAGGAAAITALSTNADDVAAASAGGIPNGNALNLATVRTTSGVEAQWNTMVGAQAQATAAAKTQRATTAARLTTAAGARDGVEGVDLDREAVDMLRFQQAYEGSARIVQLAREIINTIMGLFK